MEFAICCGRQNFGFRNSSHYACFEQEKGEDVQGQESTLPCFVAYKRACSASMYCSYLLLVLEDYVLKYSVNEIDSPYLHVVNLRF